MMIMMLLLMRRMGIEKSRKKKKVEEDVLNIGVNLEASFRASLTVTFESLIQVMEEQNTTTDLLRRPTKR